MADTKWFIPFIDGCDKTELYNMLIEDVEFEPEEVEADNAE